MSGLCHTGHRPTRAIEMTQRVATRVCRSGSVPFGNRQGSIVRGRHVDNDSSGLTAAQRPPLTAELTGAELRRWYFLRDELAAFARRLGVSAAGGKQDLTDRLAAARRHPRRCARPLASQSNQVPRTDRPAVRAQPFHPAVVPGPPTGFTGRSPRRLGRLPFGSGRPARTRLTTRRRTRTSRLTGAGCVAHIPLHPLASIPQRGMVSSYLLPLQGMPRGGSG